MSGRPESPLAAGRPARLAELRKLGETAGEEQAGPDGADTGDKQAGPDGADTGEELAGLDGADTGDKLAGPDGADDGEEEAGGDRSVASARLGMSDLEYLEFMVCLAPLLEKGAEIDARLLGASDSGRAKRKRPGRPREYGVSSVLAYEVTASHFGSYSAAQDNLADPANYRRLCEAVEAAHPDRPEWRLPAKPMNRSKHYRFRKDHLDDGLYEELHSFVRSLAVEVAVAVGMIAADDKNSYTYPSPAIAGDATLISALFKTHHTKAALPGKKKKRTDFDAITRHSNNPKAVGSAGHNATILGMRNPHGNERVILDVDLAGHDPPDEQNSPEINTNNDASVATSMYLNLLQEFPEELADVHLFIYDMAHRSVDADRVLDAGKIPLTKIPLTAEGKYAEKNLGPHNFKAKNGNKATFEVYAVNGAPGLILPDGNGELWFHLLERVQTKPVRRKNGKTVIQGTWAIPDYNKTSDPDSDTGSDNPDSDEPRRPDEEARPTTKQPPPLVGFERATTTITHNSSKTERRTKPHTRRTLALRPIPEWDPWFRKVFGKREDLESINSWAKAKLLNGRCRNTGKNSVKLTLLSFQLESIVTTLIAYQKRTEADLSEWFGKHQLPERLRPGPDLKAA